MSQFLWGALAMACVTAGLLFLRFWDLSRERLFMFFALAFLVFAINWISLAVVNPSEETRHYFHLLRLLAFGLIIVGIIDKNRRAPRG